MRRLESDPPSPTEKRSGGAPVSERSLPLRIDHEEAPSPEGEDAPPFSRRRPLTRASRDTESDGTPSSDAPTPSDPMASDTLVEADSRFARRREHENRLVQCRTVLEQARQVAASTRKVLAHYQALAKPRRQARSFFYRSIAPF